MSLRGAQRRGNPSSSLRRTFKKTCHCEPVRTLVRQSVFPTHGTILPCIRRGRPPDDPPDTRHTPCRMGITDSHVAALLVMTVHEKRPVMRRGGVLPRPLALHWQKPVSLRTSAHAGVAIPRIFKHLGRKTKLFPSNRGAATPVTSVTGSQRHTFLTAPSFCSLLRA